MSEPSTSPTDYSAGVRAPNRPAARNDAPALGFGLAFLVFGICGLLQTAGIAVDASSLSAIVLTGLGAAGLWSVLASQRRPHEKRTRGKPD